MDESEQDHNEAPPSRLPPIAGRVAGRRRPCSYALEIVSHEAPSLSGFVVRRRRRVVDRLPASVGAVVRNLGGVRHWPRNIASRGGRSLGRRNRA